MSTNSNNSNNATSSTRPGSSAAVAQFEQRKRQHLEFALDPQHEASGGSGLQRMHLHHEALPELDFADIDISCQRLGHSARTPFMVSSMTAGHSDGRPINLTLAQACEASGWAMGVGSQRRQLFDFDAQKEWQTLRKLAPQLCLYGNIGLAQAITTPSATLQQLCDSLQARALLIHTNPLQECLQPEGTPQFAGGLEALQRLCADLSIPVVLKETGCGFSPSTLQRLNGIGLAAVDVSGFGGTHWGRIEGARAGSQQDPMRESAAVTFSHWGEPTLQCLLAARAISPDYEIWASGGVRTGLDAAKLLALGATSIGLAKPMLQAALNGVDAVIQAMNTCEYELQTAMFCSGSRNINSLREEHKWHIQT